MASLTDNLKARDASASKNAAVVLSDQPASGPSPSLLSCQSHYCVTHLSHLRVKWVARSVFVILQLSPHKLASSGRIPSIGSPRTFAPVWMSCRRPLHCWWYIRASLSRLHLLYRMSLLWFIPTYISHQRCGFLWSTRPNVVTASSPFSVICNKYNTHTVSILLKSANMFKHWHKLCSNNGF